MVPAAFLLLGIKLLCSQVGKFVNSGQMIRKALIGEMVNGVLQLLDFSLNNQLLVNIITFPVDGLFAKKTNLTIRIPSGMANPFPEIKDLSGDGKPRILRLFLLEFEDFFLEFGRDPFIGIQRENPGKRSLAVPIIFLVRKIHPFALEDAVGKFSGDFYRVVYREAVNDDNFRSESSHALESGFNSLFLVISDDDN